MIGHVQRRKAREVAGHFALVHSLDSLTLAQRLDRAAGEGGRRLRVLLECNVSGEASKFGFPARTADERAALVTGVDKISAPAEFACAGVDDGGAPQSEGRRSAPGVRLASRITRLACAELGQPSWPGLSPWA